ncbi:DUF1648 domain-containing protein [Kurthia zopfii]|uniref:DUF1648 domain-containing protein n=1 Tax=Kurthia zopfii TaxID=1650 RepID=UPI000F6E118E|nr:DUF1648 domain-containing protein [Kurthia zopfii]VEI07346.1 Predicted membrane protein [Kurthia zopfii]
MVKKEWFTTDSSKSKLESIYSLIAYLVLLFTVVFIVIKWSNVPEIIPTHFDALGRVNDTGSKWLVLIFPAILYVTVSLFNFFKKHPEWANYPSRVNESNANEFWAINRETISNLSSSAILFFSIATFNFISSAIGWVDFINGYSFIILLIVLFIFPVIIQIVKMKKIK